MAVRTTVEPLERHKVKLHVEVDAKTFDEAVDAASRKLASEARVPGFRRGKVPRRLLEARLGPEMLREEALKHAIPDYYEEAIRAESIDAVSVPEIENVSAEEGEDISFDAVVEVRPKVELGDWKGSISITVPDPEAGENDVAAQVDRLRQQFAELEPVGRPAIEGDFVTIDIRGHLHSEEVPGTTATDLLYQVGSGGVVAKLDEQLTGARVGDILKFNDTLPEAFGERSGEEVSFSVLVKEVSSRRMPEVTDQWVQEVSEFETVDELKADIANRVGAVRKVETAFGARDQVIEALSERVTEDPPDAMVGNELEHVLERFLSRLHQQNVELRDYLEATGESEQELLETMKSRAVRGVKADLALRAVAETEGLAATEKEVEEEIRRLAERADTPPPEMRRNLARSGALDMLRSDIVKRAALEFAVRNVEIKTESGTVLDIDQLLRPNEAGSPNGLSDDSDDSSQEELSE